MFFINNFKKSYCPNGCELFSDNSNYTYWENKKVTSDEVEITEYLNNLNTARKIKVLHIGIGNSYLAKTLKNFIHIDGISISNNEIQFAKNLKINNYKCFFLNKLSDNSFNFFKKNNYDFIIDVNLKSFSCCDVAFNKMFSNYVSILNLNGSILCSKNGLNWSRLLKPVYRFSFKDLFHKRLKEYDGPKSNLLSANDCNKIAINNSINFYEVKNTNIIGFKS